MAVVPCQTRVDLFGRQDERVDGAPQPLSRFGQADDKLLPIANVADDEKVEIARSRAAAGRCK